MRILIGLMIGWIIFLTYGLDRTTMKVAELEARLDAADGP